MGLRPCVRVVLGGATSPLDSLGEAFRAQAEALLAAALAEYHPDLRIQSDTPAGVFLEVALLLQRAHRYPVFWSRSNILADNRCEAAFEHMRSSVVDDIVGFALTLVRVALGLEERDTLDKISRYIHKRMSIGLLHLFAHDRMVTSARLGIPCHAGYGMPGYLVRIGQGAAAQILAAGATVATSKLGREIAGEKNLTYRFLLERGLPVARQVTVHGAEEAVRAAAEIGYPVVLKPLRANRGRGVSVNLQNADAVRLAYKLSSEIQTRAVVERYLPGDDYRLLVVGGKFTAAAQRPPPSVVGDGVHNLQELVSLANKIERRDGVLFDPIDVNAEALRLLAEQGMQLGLELDRDKVPPAGLRIFFRRSASPASTTIDATDRVHPDNKAVAVAAARACFLDVAGVDFMSPDIARSWKENGAGIVEVNAGPAVDLHMFPMEGKRRDISWHAIRSRMTAHSPGRIPIIMVTGRYNKQAISRWSANLLALCGYQVATEVAPSPEASAFTDPETDAGLLEMSLRTLAQEGIALDRVAVTVISDEFPPSGDAGESAYIPDVAARLYRLAMDVACEAVVIDGADAALRQAAQRRPAWQVGYVWSMKADDAPLERHIQAGGWAVVSEADESGDLWIKLWRGSERRAIVRMADIFHDAKPENGLYAQQREAMLACAAVIGMGVQAETLAAPLRAAALEPTRFSTLVVRLEQQPALATLDPRDRLSRNRLTAFVEAGHGMRPWLVLPEERDVLENAGALCREFDKLQPYWCVAGGNRALADELLQGGVPARRILAFADVETAWEALQSQAQTDDLIALLSADEILRRSLCRECRQPRTDARVFDGLWEAGELAQQFDGAWVNGARRGWGVNDIAWGAEGASNGGMVVIDGAPDDSDSLAQVEKNILRAFERGAAGVVAPMVPLDLPRWQAVLVCDVPARGLERLARAARRRFAGAAVALSGDGAISSAAALRAYWMAIEGAGAIFLDEARAGEAHATALALARTPPQADIALYPAAWDVLAIGQIKPALWIVLVTDQENELRALESLGILPSSCRIIAVAPRSSFAAWDKRLVARRTPLFILLDWESAAEETTGVLDEGILERLAYAAHDMLYPRERDR